MINEATRIGSVQDVNGENVNAVLDIDNVPGCIFIEGEGYKIGQIGSFISIPIGFIELFGIISKVGAGAVPEKLIEREPFGNRWVSIQLIGEINSSGVFIRGISQYPTIGDQVHIVTQFKMELIYGNTSKKQYVEIGHLASASSIPALIDIDKLLTRHCAIVGATGCGKSTTVTSILQSLTNNKMFPSARVIVLDIHGEYAKALRDNADIFRINPEKDEKKLCVPYWALTFNELLSITMGNLEGQQRGAVHDKILEMKVECTKKFKYSGVEEESITVDTPIPFSIHKMWLELYRLEIATFNDNAQKVDAFETDEKGMPIQVGDANNVIPPKYKPCGISNTPPNNSKRFNGLRRQLESLASKLRDTRLNFLFRPDQWMPNVNDGTIQQDLDELLRLWVGGDKAISILDLSGIPSEILSLLVGVLLRIIYDALFWGRNLSEGGRERPLLIVLEEAHAYLNKSDKAENATKAVQRIVKEGRKYGIGAMLVSQRPSEIDTTILSQCGTIISMRLNNTEDRSHVIGAVSDNLEGLLKMLPTLRVGEAIILGEAVRLPIRTLIHLPQFSHRPDSEDPQVYERWSSSRVPSDYCDVVSLWREQSIRSKKYVSNILRKEEE